MNNNTNTQLDQSAGKMRELRVFLFLTVILAPVLAVMIVGGYGLLVWIYQHLTGPPTY